MAVYSTADVVLPERYAPLRHIADGGMASVWCAEDRVLGRRVAIKLLGERYLDDDVAERRFLREARVAARVSGHPNVVTIYDVGEVEGRGFIVMEHLAGGTVADALRVGAIDLGTSVRWLREAADALDHAHRHGVIHRDVKPANLLLDGTRILHVADFGIARLASEASITHTGLVLGSAGYLAPEQALGHPATEASDRYALAVTAFELLTGRRPYDGPHPVARGAAAASAELPRVTELAPDLPAEVDDVLARGMANVPQHRWPTAVAMVDALEAALARGGETTTIAVMADPRARRAAGAAPTGARQAAGDPIARPIARPQTRARMAAMGAIAVLVIAVAAIAANSASRGSRGSLALAHPRTRAAGHSAAATKAASTAAATQAARTAGRSQTTSAPSGSGASTASAATTSATAGAASGSAGAGADALEAQGHALLAGGSAGQAVPILQRAVQTAGPGSLTYAYALYDLGRALRLSGNPQAAIPILQQRLRIPNQTGIVQQELNLALAAAHAGGASVAAPPAPDAAPPGPGDGPGRGKGKGHGKHGDGGGD